MGERRGAYGEGGRSRPVRGDGLIAGGGAGRSAP